MPRFIYYTNPLRVNLTLLFSCVQANGSLTFCFQSAQYCRAKLLTKAFIFFNFLFHLLQKIAKPEAGERAVNGWLVVAWLVLVCSLTHREIPHLLLPLFFSGRGFFFACVVFIVLSIVQASSWLGYMPAAVELHHHSVSENPFLVASMK